MERQMLENASPFVSDSRPACYLIENFVLKTMVESVWACRGQKSLRKVSFVIGKTKPKQVFSGLTWPKFFVFSTRGNLLSVQGFVWGFSKFRTSFCKTWGGASVHVANLDGNKIPL